MIKILYLSEKTYPFWISRWEVPILILLMTGWCLEANGALHVNEVLVNTVTAETVTGQVTDDTGEPLIGVNIQVKGTNKGTSTDFEGHFTLEDICLLYTSPSPRDGLL